MAQLHIVRLSTVPCKIIGCTNRCWEGKYTETQTNQNLCAQIVTLNERLKVVYIPPNMWPW